MKKREAIDAIFRELGNIISAYGFKYHKRDSKCSRSFKGGNHSFTLSLVDHGYFFFTFGIGIRLDEVEDIFHMFSGSSTDLRKHNATVMRNLSYFINLRQHFPDTQRPRQDIQISTENEIREAFQILSPVLREKIIPFLDMHKDVASIDKLVNSEGNSENKFGVVRGPVRDMHELIVAHLAKNPRFDAILATKQKELEGINELDATKFAKLVEYLTTQRKPQHR